MFASGAVGAIVFVVYVACVASVLTCASACGGVSILFSTFVGGGNVPNVSAVALVCEGDMLEKLGVLVTFVPRYAAGAFPLFTNRFLLATGANDSGIPGFSSK